MHEAAGHYEFVDKDAKAIATLGRRARLWGVMAIVSGVLGLAALVGVGYVVWHFRAELAARDVDPAYLGIGLSAVVPFVLVHLVTGGLYIASGSRLIAVDRSQGRDLQHLLVGFERLTGAFKVESIVTAVGIVVGLAIAVAMGWLTANALGFVE